MGNLVEMEELQQINGFDKKTIVSILPYVTVTIEKRITRSNQVTIRLQKNLTNFQNYYPGSDIKILTRLKINPSPFIDISFTGEKDAGEEFFSRNKKGFDFNSINITYNGKSLIKKMMIGDYNLEYGQGLTAWSGLSFGSGASITGIFKNGRGIVPYSGTDENRFLRGFAVSTQLGKFRNDAWLSYHGIDGNMITDTLSKERYISSFQTSGYHRTFSENMDFHAEKELAVGWSTIYHSNKLRAGIVFSALSYSLPVRKTDQAYKKFDFGGNTDNTGSIFYSLIQKNIFVFGENAWNIKNAYAFLNGILVSLDPRASLGFLYRFYSKEFPALKSNAYGANTRNSNEEGSYLGLNLKISKTLIYSGYIDIFSFPFIKYRVDHTSHGFDFFQQLDINLTKKFNAQVRYRKRLKQQNENTDYSKFNLLTDFFYHSFRFSARFKMDNTWEYAFRSELSIKYSNKKRAGMGSMISQDLLFHPMGKPYSMGVRYAVFSCSDFDNRIYEYENDVQGAFSIPFYYGIGNRFYTNVSWKFGRGLTLSLKYAKTIKDQETESNGSSDIKVQVKYIFM
jgi:hypothetical protein